MYQYEEEPTWYFEIKYGNDCMVGGHFYTREEMFEWFSNMLKYYTFSDKFYELKIWEVRDEDNEQERGEKMNKKYTREELLNICEKAFVNEKKWKDRDSESSQCQLGECYALLKDGCDFKIIYDDSICSTDEDTIWLYVYSKGFTYFEYYDLDEDSEWNKRYREEHRYYLPTLKRLTKANGEDWY